MDLPRAKSDNRSIEKNWRRFDYEFEKLAAGLLAFVCGVGLIGFGQYLSSFFQTDKNETAAVCPPVEQQTVFVPTGVLPTPASVETAEQMFEK